MTISKIIIGVFLAIALITQESWATTYYVGKSGNDANSCSTAQSSTAGNRKLTIAAGVGCLSAGDTLIVGDGTYTEEISTIPSGSAGVGYTIIQAENNRLAIISTTTADGSSTAANGKFPIFLESKAYIRIDGFVLNGGESPFLVYPDGDHIELINSTAKLGHQSGVKAYRCTNCLFDKNIVYDNSRVNWPRGTSNVNATSWAGGINLVLSSNSTISNNQIYWNHGEGMSCFRNCVNITMNNNIVADNWSVNVYLDHSNGGVVEGNLIYQSADARAYAYVGCCNGNNASGIEISAENYGETPILNNVKIRRNIVVNSSVCLNVARNNINVNWTNFEISGNSCFGDQHGLFIQNTGGTITEFAIKNNLINIAGTNLYSAVLNPNTSGNTLSHNIYQASSVLFSYNGSDTSSYANWASNSGETNSSYANPGNVDKTYIPPRLWDDGVLGSPAAVSSIVLTNYGLTSSAAAINAGTTAIVTGVTACKNNTNPALGAIQDIGPVAATVDGTSLVISVTNNCTNTMIPASTVTGFSAKRAGSADAISSLNRTGSNSFLGVLADAFTAGQACLFSYSQSTGNAIAADSIGNTTLGRQEIFSFTDADCTNLTGGGGATVNFEHWRFYLLQGGTPGTWIGKCLEDSTDCVTAPGSKLWVLLKLHNQSGSAFPTFNLRPRVRYNGGSYVTITDSYVNGIKMLGTGAQLGTVLTSGTQIATALLTGEASSLFFCIANRSASSIPSVDLGDDTETECAIAVDISTSAAIGDTYEFCPYDDAGNLISCATPAKLTIGSYGAVR